MDSLITAFMSSRCFSSRMMASKALLTMAIRCPRMLPDPSTMKIMCRICRASNMLENVWTEGGVSIRSSCPLMLRKKSELREDQSWSSWPC